jgi:hypothetical protein
LPPCCFQIYQYRPKRDQKADLDAAIAAFPNDMHGDIENITQEFTGLKAWMLMYVVYASADPIKENQILPAKLFTKFTIFSYMPPHLYHYDPLKSPYIHGLEFFGEQLKLANAKFIKDKSGFVLSEITALNLNCIQYTPLVGSHFLPLPKFLQHKKAIVNIRNHDDRCFGYALLSAFIEKSKNSRDTDFSENDFARFYLDYLDYPISPLRMAEMQEKLLLNINLYSFSDGVGKHRYPMFTGSRKYTDTIDLFYWEGHYAWISSFERLFNDLYKRNGRLFWCRRCLMYFTNEERFQRHSQLCSRPDYCSIMHTLPPPGSTLKFRYV